MHATLLGEDPPSIYRGKPSPEVDAAWARLSASHAVPITKDEVKRLGKDPVTAAKFPESFGYGDDAYVAQIDVSLRPMLPSPLSAMANRAVFRSSIKYTVSMRYGWRCTPTTRATGRDRGPSCEKRTSHTAFISCCSTSCVRPVWILSRTTGWKAINIRFQISV